MKNGKVKLNYIEEDLKYQTLNWFSTYRSGNTMLDLDIYVTSIKMKLNDFLCLSNNHFDDIELNLSTIQLCEIFCFLFDFKFLDKYLFILFTNYKNNQKKALSVFFFSARKLGKFSFFETRVIIRKCHFLFL